MMFTLPGAADISKNIFCSRKLKNQQNGCISDDYAEELKGLIGERWNEVWSVVKARHRKKQELSEIESAKQC